MEIILRILHKEALRLSLLITAKMIELAKRRQSQYAKQIEFCVADATDRKSILELKRNRAFTKAVSNMAIMDITDIEPLLMAVYELLQESGILSLQRNTLVLSR